MKLKKVFIASFMILCLVHGYAQKKARVIGVKDADTYIFEIDKQAVTVRLNKIDAPELKQPSGVSAFEFVQNLIIGKIVTYESTGKDKYGRLLASAKLDGKRLDSLIICNGWAWHYVVYDKEVLLQTMQEMAITNHLGLWKCGLNKVCPPWIWRSYNARNRAKYCKGCTY
jgi:micrococcal nuclease